MSKTVFKIIALLIAVLLIPINAAAGRETSDWTVSELAEAISLGFVPDEFHEDYSGNITRAEFAKTAVLFLSVLYDTEIEKIMSDSGNVFSDTDDPYVNTAFEYGIISGIGDGTFAPDKTITRQEAAKIVMNAYTAYRGSDWEAVPCGFEDLASIAPWAVNEVSCLKEWDVINGVGENKFAPQDNYTREQSAVVFLRLYKKLMPDDSNSKRYGLLRVDNGRITNGFEEVVLNGINLGGWMLMETWLSPIEDKTEEMSYTEIIDILENRFGKKTARELIDTYEENFITENDFKRIKELGFNCVRIPFWYRNFMTEDGEWLRGGATNNSGFMRLDWALEMCEKYNLYAVLDMHGCPGGQSMNHSTGQIGKNRLYNTENNLKIMEKLWTQIAKRYKNREIIAAYDIMNEPQNNGGYTGPRSWQAESETAVFLTNSVYRRMIEAIREVDRNHIITIEGIWKMEILPNPKDYGWENMMYQLHIYDTSKEMIDKRVAEMNNAREEFGVAVLVGEYNSQAFEKYATEKYNENKISRIKWTYKVIGDNIDSWGIYVKSQKKLDIKKASLKDIKRIFLEDIRTENGFVFNEEEYKSIR